MKNRPFHQRLGFAIKGITAALSRESSLRLQTLAAVAAYCVLYFLRAPPMWFAIFTLAIGGVLSAELFNTVLEHLMDHLHPQQHPNIQFAKDCAAGAVLVLSLSSLLVLACFLFERFVLA